MIFQIFSLHYSTPGIKKCNFSFPSVGLKKHWLNTWVWRDFKIYEQYKTLKNCCKLINYYHSCYKLSNQNTQQWVSMSEQWLLGSGSDRVVRLCWKAAENHTTCWLNLCAEDWVDGTTSDAVDACDSPKTQDIVTECLRVLTLFKLLIMPENLPKVRSTLV